MEYCYNRVLLVKDLNTFSTTDTTTVLLIQMVSIVHYYP